MKRDTIDKLINGAEDFLNEARDIDFDDKTSMMWSIRCLRRSKNLITKAELYLKKLRERKRR